MVCLPARVARQLTAHSRTVTQISRGHANHPAELMPGRRPATNKSRDADSDSSSSLSDVESDEEGEEQAEEREERDAGEGTSMALRSDASDGVPVGAVPRSRIEIGATFEDVEAFNQAVREHGHSAREPFDIISGGHHQPMLGGSELYRRGAARVWRCEHAQFGNLATSCGFYVRATQSTLFGPWCVVQRCRAC